MGQQLHRFLCPLCCIRKNRPYEYSEVRVKHFDNSDEDTYVNTTLMLETSSKDIIYKTLPRPYTQTLIVELIRYTSYTSGSSEVVNCPPPPHSVLTPPLARPPESGPSASHRLSHTPLPLPTPPTPVYELARQPSTNGHHVPPPPPWSTQWHNITSNPTPTRRSEVPEYSLPPPPPLSLSPHSGKKRKFADESPPPEARGSRSPKQTRRLPQTPILPPASVPARAMQQTLSPSLAMIVSPVDTEPSPRPASSVPYSGPASSSQRPSNTPPVKPIKLVMPKNK
ncbi:hypothetical protein EV401DRAFT_2084698 [Pisolithus croceorrhizus]|nr:hypothetical protein EV401DRAFT_2084698 [Pisolithus croceorrhizus]